MYCTPHLCSEVLHDKMPSTQQAAPRLHTVCATMAPKEALVSQRRAHQGHLHPAVDVGDEAPHSCRGTKRGMRGLHGRSGSTASPVRQA